MNPSSLRPSWHLAATLSLIAALVAGCASPPAVMPPSATATPQDQPQHDTASVVSPLMEATDGRQSGAASPRDYRRDAASHLYDHNAKRIFKGKMPPLLYAVGVLQVDVDAKGRVTATRWMRAPSHAPEVVAEIERTVRQAEPYPAPVRLGRVTYTDTWLWHKSGKFQLDTLTEGQY